MGLSTTVQYCAFAECKKRKEKVTEIEGKRCTNGHVFSSASDNTLFCPKCGEKLIPNEVIKTKPVPDTWDLDELFNNKIRPINFDDDDKMVDVWIDNDDRMSNTGKGIDMNRTKIYTFKENDFYKKNFEEKFKDYLITLRYHYVSVEVKVGLVVEYD